MDVLRRRSWRGLILLALAVVPPGLGLWWAGTPGDRAIHVEAFRYGKKPPVIRCRRGDRLRLTFSARDTGHSFFLEEFDLDVKITPASRQVAVFRPSEPSAGPRLTSQVVFKAEAPGWRKYLVSKSQYRCHVWCGPMHAFEHGSLILQPNTLLLAGLGLLAGIPLVGLLSVCGLAGAASGRGQDARSLDLDLLARWPWLKRLAKWRGFQGTCVTLATVFLYLVLLVLFFGTKVAARNLGSMLLWVVWLFVLTAVLVPLGGRIWCLACPLPALGEMLQRGALTGARGKGSRSGFGLGRPWPAWLANDWPRLAAMLALGTFSTVLVAVPRISGWVVLGMVLLSLATALIWKLRAFCRCLCPISTFLALYGRMGKLALRAADPEVCRRCATRACRRGSADGWACPFGLCVAEIHDNRDCGLCTECLKTCPHDNVALRWRPLAEETEIRSTSEAWLAMSMLVLAVAYSVVHLGPWPEVRDWVNVLDKGNWGLFGLYAAVLWATALVGFPALMLLPAAIGKRLSRISLSSWRLMIASTGALLPLGLMAWIAFVVPMLMVNASFVAQSCSDPFGWGWDFFGTANMPWRQLWPEAIPWIQVGCILLGLHYSLRNAWRIWRSLADDPRAALRGMVPLALLLVTISGWLLWFHADA